jgi:polar amino acid transport system substrate-binding protein
VFVPWAMPGKDGKLIGFEVDVAQKLADDLGVELELVPTAWDGIIPALIGGKFDFIIGGLTITPKRALTINFSIPYDYAETLAVVNKKIAPQITTLKQLNSPDVTFASRRGATSGVAIAALFPLAKEVPLDDENAIEQELVNGNVTATMPSTPTPALLESRHPDIVRVIHEPIARSASGFGMRKGDPDALAYVNAWITFYTNNHWLQDRHAYWFDGRSWANLVDGGK